MQHKKSNDDNFENERRILRLILEKWFGILIISLGIALISFIFLLISSKPVYKAEGSFLVNNRQIVGLGKETDSILTTNDISVSQQLAKVCKLALTANSTVDNVIEKGSLDLSREELLDGLKISVMENTNVLYLSYSCHEPEKSYKVVSTYMDILHPTLMQIADATSVVIFDKPVYPEKAESNRMLFIIPALLFLLTAAVLIICIIIRDMFRDTVKSVKQFKDQIGIKIIGNIPTKYVPDSNGFFLKEKHSRNKNSAFLFLESFNTLRSKILAHNKKTGDTVYLTTSAIPHEGKSTINCGIAKSLAKNSYNVLIIDMDYRQPRIADEMKVKQPYNENCWNNIFNISESKFEEICVSGELGMYINQCIISGRQKNIDLMLPMARTSDKTPKEFDLSVFEKIINELKKRYDYILIDTPPVNLFADAVVLAEFADATMLIVRKDFAFIPQINDVAAELEQNSREFMGCILNEFYSTNSNRSNNYYGYYY